MSSEEIKNIEQAIWTKAINIAHGCHDYGGGHRGECYSAFQHGISTVAECLERKLAEDDSYQLRFVERIGEER